MWASGVRRAPAVRALLARGADAPTSKVTAPWRPDGQRHAQDLRTPRNGAQWRARAAAARRRARRQTPTGSPTPVTAAGCRAGRTCDRARIGDRHGPRLVRPRRRPPTPSSATGGAFGAARGLDEPTRLATENSSGSQGGLTRRCCWRCGKGMRDRIAALLDGGARREPGERGRPHLAAPDGRHQRAVRRRDGRSWRAGPSPRWPATPGRRRCTGSINKCNGPPRRATPQHGLSAATETATYLALMAALLKGGADPNARLKQARSGSRRTTATC
jgi:hypothetical protein